MRDVFISYSSKDRDFVDDLCSKLRRRNVTFWLDRFEIKPGDYIRDKINLGLQDAEYLLVIFSPISIKSEWVKREIDVAMMNELANRKVVLIPLLIGNIQHSDLPPDLQGKLYLDFRSGPVDKGESLQRLLDLLKPDVKRRKELIVELRAGFDGSRDRLAKLREFALTGTDQEIQKAALTGLAATRSPQAVAIIVERFIDTWGLNAINHAARMLRKLEIEGIAGLAATIFWDDRLIRDKFAIICNYLRNDVDFIEYITLSSAGGRIPLAQVSLALTDHSPPLIAAAANYSAHFWFKGSPSQSFLPNINKNRKNSAEELLDIEVPGLTNVISSYLKDREALHETRISDRDYINLDPLP